MHHRYKFYKGVEVGWRQNRQPTPTPIELA